MNSENLTSRRHYSDIVFMSTSTPSSVSDIAPQPNPPESPPSPERPQAWQVASNLGASFRYAGQGIYYALRTQRNFRIHSLATGLVVTTGLVLRLPAVHIAVLSLTCGLVMTLELLNTALEAVVDLTVQQTYHELAKIAKDCAAGAVLTAALMAVVVGSCLLLPPLVPNLFHLFKV